LPLAGRAGPECSLKPQPTAAGKRASVTMVTPCCACPLIGRMLLRSRFLFLYSNLLIEDWLIVTNLSEGVPLSENPTDTLFHAVARIFFFFFFFFLDVNGFEAELF